MPPPASNRSARSRRCPVVLVVDDHEDTRELIAEFVSISGFKSLTANDGQEAVELAHRELPDVIVMDVAMPRMTGIEATQALRGSSRTRALPILILTGQGNETLRSALAAGANAAYAKPCPLETIVAAVRGLLSVSRSGA